MLSSQTLLPSVLWLMFGKGQSSSMSRARGGIVPSSTETQLQMLLDNRV